MTLSAEQVVDAQMLHDRATRGEALTADEQRRLRAWYAELEQQEAQVLFGKPAPPPATSAERATAEAKLARLQQEVDSLLTQLAATTTRLREVMQQNKRLRSEVAALRALVAQQVTLDVALPAA